MRDNDLADRPADVTVSPPQVLAKGYRVYERFHVALRAPDGGIARQERDVIRAGLVASVLPIDLEREEVVLIRQFRLPAHLAAGNGDEVEIVAGGIEPNERPIDAAARECREETGLSPKAIVEVLDYMTSPGITDERIVMYVASVDASQAPPRTELEGEYIEVLRVPFDDAIAACAANKIRNGLAIIALQWLALNRARLPALLKTQR